jgi:hypothetical protein
VCHFYISAFRELLGIKKAMIAHHKPKCLSKIIILTITKYYKGPSTQGSNFLVRINFYKALTLKR